MRVVGERVGVLSCVLTAAFERDSGGVKCVVNAGCDCEWGGCALIAGHCECERRVLEGHACEWGVTTSSLSPLGPAIRTLTIAAAAWPLSHLYPRVPALCAKEVWKYKPPHSSPSPPVEAEARMYE